MTETTGHEQQQDPSAGPADHKPPPAAEQDPAFEYVEVYVSAGDMQSTAQALLDAAGEDIERVETVSGGFRVPRAVADRAGVAPTDDTGLDPARTGAQAAREGSGRAVSADEIIAADLESGAASAAAVGAVFASNSPTGQDVAEQDTSGQDISGQAGEEPGTAERQPETAGRQEAEPAETPAEQQAPAGESSEQPETGSGPAGKGRRRTGEPRTAGGDGR